MTLLTAGYASGAAVGKFPFDGDNTFGFLSMVCAYPFVYPVPKDSPIQSFPDMLARAKANPGKLTYVITSLGSIYHLIGSWVGSKAGIDMVPVPYRGSANAVTDVMGGRVDVMLDTATSGFPRIASGQFRALAVTSPTRYPLLPDAPTVAETLPGVHYMSWLGMAAAPRTPRPIVDRLNAELHRALDTARRPGQAQGGRQYRDADHARGDAPADRRRDRQLEADHRGQQHQGELARRPCAGILWRAAPRTFHAKNEQMDGRRHVPRRERERNAMMKRRDFLVCLPGAWSPLPLSRRRRWRPTIRASRCAGSSATCRAAPPTSWRA